MLIDIVFALAILIMSVVVHEVAHGYAALFLGDHTAEYQGRLTLNPIRHLDLFGSVIVPLISFLLGGVIFGWAKPVPYNPYNLQKGGKWAEAIVAFAGPFVNIFLAVSAGLVLRFGVNSFGEASPMTTVLVMIVITNVVLAIFNLVPIPPLDGSKILFAIMPARLKSLEDFWVRYGLIIIIIIILFFGWILSPVISFLFKLITGLSI